MYPNISGIKILKPTVSSHEKAYVYAMDNPVTGLLFGARHNEFAFLIDCNKNGIPVVCKCYPDVFCSVFRSKNCSIYELDDDVFLRGVTEWSPKLICETEVPI